MQEMYNMSLKDFSNYILIDYSQFFWSIFNKSFVKRSQYMNWGGKDWCLWMVEPAVWTRENIFKVLMADRKEAFGFGDKR